LDVFFAPYCIHSLVGVLLLGLEVKELLHGQILLLLPSATYLHVFLVILLFILEFPFLGLGILLDLAWFCV
jgi:hypothetical protein